VGVGQGKAAQDVHFIENGMPDFNAPVPDRYVDGGQVAAGSDPMQD
jgi:hypothetical protein